MLSPRVWGGVARKLLVFCHAFLYTELIAERPGCSA